MDPRRPWALLVLAGLAVFGATRTPGSARAPAVPAVEAVGALDELPVRLQRAFEVTDAFAPLPKPGPGGWLAIHDEPLQTAADDLASKPNVPAPPRNVLYVLPIGPLPAERGPTLDELLRHATRSATCSGSGTACRSPAS